MLKVTMPPRMSAEVTVCSPCPYWFKSMNQPLMLEPATSWLELQEVDPVLLLTTEVSSRLTDCALVGFADRLSR